RDRTNTELSTLYRLALDMGAATEAKDLAQVVLAGLKAATDFDIGAVLLLPRGGAEQSPKASQLTVVAYTGKGEGGSYHKVSSRPSSLVLSTREAILARDAQGDARITDREVLGEMQAQSVICAPIQSANVIFGLVHLYSTDPKRAFQREDLEFTIAVADQMAV